MSLLKDKVALITGAGGGIGRGVARCFAREGAAVLIAELDPVTGAEAEHELRQMGGRALFVRTDVLSKDSVEASIQAAVDHFGGLDILVNNAFVPSENVLLEDKTDAMLERTLTSTVWASWWAMRAAMPHMRQRGGGRIINFTSIDVDIGAWQHADYNTGKSGVVGLTRSAAAEWADSTSPAMLLHRLPWGPHSTSWPLKSPVLPSALQRQGLWVDRVTRSWTSAPWLFFWARKWLGL